MTKPRRATLEPDRFTAEQYRDYYDAMQGKGPRELLLQTLELFDRWNASEGVRLAVDIGCGEGRDTAELLRQGFRVFAFDGQEEGIQRLLSRPDLPPNADVNLTARVIRYEYASWPRCNLANAAYSLPFCPPDVFPLLWQRIRVSLLSGGLFCGQLFGDRDGWAGQHSMTHQTRQEAEALLSPFQIEHFSEEEHDGTTAVGTPKHWHVFHFIARKP